MEVFEGYDRYENAAYTATYDKERNKIMFTDPTGRSHYYSFRYFCTHDGKGIYESDKYNPNACTGEERWQCDDEDFRIYMTWKNEDHRLAMLKLRKHMWNLKRLKEYQEGVSKLTLKLKQSEEEWEIAKEVLRPQWLRVISLLMVYCTNEYGCFRHGHRDIIRRLKEFIFTC